MPQGVSSILMLDEKLYRCPYKPASPQKLSILWQSPLSQNTTPTTLKRQQQKYKATYLFSAFPIWKLKIKYTHEAIWPEKLYNIGNIQN